MPKSDSSRSVKPAKPSKPTPDYPLFPHASGQWAKKIRQRVYYFGVWADPEAALAEYERQKDALHSGRTPRANADDITIKDAFNHYLSAARRRMESGELARQTMENYEKFLGDAIAILGKSRPVDDLRAEDFGALKSELAKRYRSLHSLANVVQCVRSVFRYCHEIEAIARLPRFGPDFRGATAKGVRLHRAKRDQQARKLFTAEELRQLLEAARVPFRAMVLLGINCGFGNHDCAALPLSAVDLDGGWIDYPRPKNAVARRCPLWPETVAAIRAAIAQRPEPKSPDVAGLVFLTRFGVSWGKGSRKVGDPIGNHCYLLTRDIGIKRSGLSFYALRHTFRTVADESRDQPACDYIMGHSLGHISTVYRERIGDDRLRSVADHVHRWLFPPTE
jgi:integrase